MRHKETKFKCSADCNSRCIDRCLTAKNKQLEQEVKELKSHVEYLVDVVDEVSTATNANMLPQEVRDLAANAIASVPEQSLAQHDKEVVTLFVSNINETGQFGWSDCQWLTDYVEEYFEQLQQGE